MTSLVWSERITIICKIASKQFCCYMIFLYYYVTLFCFFFFFFQAEDGIRDLTVTGVQTCALPIYIESVALLTAQCVVLRGSERSSDYSMAPTRTASVAPWALVDDGRPPVVRDRKSTRLNSSHSQISYAVFCLKKKITHCAMLT